MRPLRRVGAALALLAIATGLGAVGAGPAAAAGAGGARVVVVGVPGLRWSDLSAGTTPALWRLATEGALGDLAVRSAGAVACSADGWLMVSTGTRSVATPDGEPCGSGAGPPQAFAPQALAQRNSRLDTGAEIGALAGALRSHGDCVATAGPLAALGGIPPVGSPAGPGSASTASATLRRLAARCPVLLVDAGSVGAPVEPARLAAADEVVARAAKVVGRGGNLLVVGLSDAGTAKPTHLHVAIGVGPAFPAGELSSPSTGRTPFVQVIDVAPTVLALLGVSRPASMTGQPWRASPEAAAGAASVNRTVRRLVDFDVAAQALGSALGWFLVALIGGQILGYALAWLLARRGHPLAGPLALGTAVVGMAGPFGSYLAQLTHWWRAAAPMVTLIAVSLGIAAVVAAVALAGPWRREPLAPPGIVAGLTAALLAADVMTGSHLQMNSVFGYSPLVAGRFTGFGNVAFGVFATAALLAATAVTVAGRSRRSAGILAAVVGGAAVVADGAPQWGSDFGGVLSLAPAVVVLALLVAGARLTWRRVLLAGAVAVGAVAAFALADYARPAAEQTHLGRFVGQVLHGGAWTVVRRKARANVDLLTGNPVNAVVPFATAYLAWLVARPPGALRDAFRARPVLRHGLTAVLVMGVIGLLTNDSGDAIPAMAMLLAIPMAIAVMAVVPRSPDREATDAEGRAEGQPPVSPTAGQGPAVLP